MVALLAFHPQDSSVSFDAFSLPKWYVAWVGSCLPTFREKTPYRLEDGLNMLSLTAPRPNPIPHPVYKWSTYTHNLSRAQTHPHGHPYFMVGVNNSLTHSTVQSPSWAANWFAASQKIPQISRNPKVHYRTYKRPPPVSILGQPNPVHMPTSHILETYPNIIHPSTPRSPQYSNPHTYSLHGAESFLSS